jgi:hypothetical protein
MTWKEAIKYCEEHHCEDCVAYYKTDCRTDYDKQNLHVPCCVNLVTESLRFTKEEQTLRKKFLLKIQYIPGLTFLI